MPIWTASCNGNEALGSALSSIVGQKNPHDSPACVSSDYKAIKQHRNIQCNQIGAKLSMRLRDCVYLPLIFAPIACQTQSSIPGIPGQDYPVFDFPPTTSFQCDGRRPGYYADPESDCQAFSICVDDSSFRGLYKFSFLCPNGTLFNQEYFVCDWWFNVDCSLAEQFYSLNDNLFVEDDN